MRLIDLKGYIDTLRERNLLLLSLSSLLFGFAFYFLTWYIPIVIMKEYGSFGLGVLYMVGTVFSVLTVFGGILADALGYKPLMLVVPLMVLCACLALILKLSYVSLLAMVIVLHLTPLAGPAIYAYISNSVPSDMLGRAFSAYRAFLLSGIALSSLVYGFITQYLGFRIALIAISITLVAATILRVVIREISPLKEQSIDKCFTARISNIFRTLITLDSRTLLILFVASFVSGVALAFGPYLYSFLRFVLKLNVAMLGLYESVCTVLNALSQVPAGSIIDRFGALHSVALALSIEILAMSSATLFVLKGLVVPCLIAILVWEVVGPMSTTALNVVLAHESSESVRGSVYGLMSSMAALMSLPTYMFFATMWALNSVMLPAYYALLMAIPLLLCLVRYLKPRTRSLIVGNHEA